MRSWRALVLAALVVLRGCRPEMAYADRATLERQVLALEELQTRQMETSFRAYAKQAWKVLEPTNPIVWNWHIDAKSDVLQGVTEGHLQHVIINEPPRNSKSSVLTLWQTWEWGPANKPATRWLCGSHSTGLATRDTRLARAVMQSPWYRRRWGHRFQFVGDQNVKTYFENDARGRRIAFGFDAGVTGEGGSRLQIDDPIDLKEAGNRKELERINATWDTALFNRVDNPEQDAKILAGQRVGKGDLYDHVKEQHDWTWLVLPAEYEPTRHTRIVLRRDECTYWVDDTGRRQRRVTGTTEHVVEDPRTEPGALLNPARFSPTVQAGLRRAAGHAHYQAQQQQNPVATEGVIIKREWFRYYRPDTLPTDPIDAIYLSVDSALKAKTSNDEWALQAWAKLGARAWLLRSIADRMSYSEGRDGIQALYRWAREKFPQAAIYVLIENTAAGPDVIVDLRKHVPGLLPVNVDQDKERRLRAVQPSFEAGDVWVPGAPLEDGTNYDPALTPLWCQQFIDEIVTFPQATTGDNRVDACSQALGRMLAAPIVLPPPTSGGSARADSRI